MTIKFIPKQKENQGQKAISPKANQLTYFTIA